MLLHTPLYLLFLSAVCIVYWSLKPQKLRKALLVIASYGFYAALDIRFALVLLGLSISTYLLGRVASGNSHANRYAGLSVALNLGALAYFKYAGFFLANIQAVVQGFGISMPVSLQLLLPVGLSFYTFQAIAYTIDISRQRIQPAASWLDFALYLAFFPKLIAGPFVRPAEFLHQLTDPPRSLSLSDTRASMQLLLLGLFKKVVIADSIAALADVSFRAAAHSQPNLFPMPLYLSGFYLYAIQIYADFSGYTDIARASAGFLGFALPQNFLQPYFASSPGDFWNRWHMTLTQWFREYLFFPLSRWGLRLTHRLHERFIQIAATMATMILVGLWHGAAWTYLLWGAWHGLLLVLDRWINFKPKQKWQTIASMVVTFHLVGIGWIIFRSASLEDAWRFFVGLLSFQQLGWFTYYMTPVFLAGVFILGIDWASRAAPRRLALMEKIRPVLLITALVVILSLWIIQAAAQTNPSQFIYGSF
jgi:D-alanyl-lipoteichoic acid acyltransferase DltB (MBOAT superfamily)